MNPPESAAPPAGARQFPKGEAAVVAALLLVFVLVNFKTSLAISPAWADEVQLADPAINLRLGYGFTSTTTSYQDKDEFWASNVPLHSALVYLWLTVFPISPIQVRALNFVLMAATLLGLWLGSLRHGLIRSAGLRLLLLAAIAGGAATAINFVAGRYDAVGFALFTAAFVVLSIERRGLRYALLGGVGFLLPFAAVQILPYGLLLVVVLRIWFRKRYDRESLSLGAGVAAGLLALFALYAAQGVARVLPIAAGGYAISGSVEVTSNIQAQGTGQKVAYVIARIPQILFTRLSHFPSWFFTNYSFLAVLAVLAALVALRPRGARFRRTSPAAFGLTIALAVPFFMGLLRDYPFYYGWMAYFPMAVCAAAELSERWAALAPRLRWALVAPLAAAGVFGWPLLLRGAVAEPGLDRAREAVDRFAADRIRSGDQVYCDFEAYYSVKPLVRWVFLPTYRYSTMPDAEKRKFTVLLVRPESVERLFDIFGKGWVKEAELTEREPYHLELYRRSP